MLLCMYFLVCYYVSSVVPMILRVKMRCVYTKWLNFVSGMQYSDASQIWPKQVKRGIQAKRRGLDKYHLCLLQSICNHCYYILVAFILPGVILIFWAVYLVLCVFIYCTCLLNTCILWIFFIVITISLSVQPFKSLGNLEKLYFIRFKCIVLWFQQSFKRLISTITIFCLLHNEDPAFPEHQINTHNSI